MKDITKEWIEEAEQDYLVAKNLILTQEKVREIIRSYFKIPEKKR